MKLGRIREHFRRTARPAPPVPEAPPNEASNEFQIGERVRCPVGVGRVKERVLGPGETKNASFVTVALETGLDGEPLTGAPEFRFWTGSVAHCSKEHLREPGALVHVSGEGILRRYGVLAAYDEGDDDSGESEWLVDLPSMSSGVKDSQWYGSGFLRVISSVDCRCEKVTSRSACQTCLGLGKVPAREADRDDFAKMVCQIRILR